ncbi:helix-turn-helix domain-containing protein [Enterobacter mori]|uniref:hypothetical protein n=1 Tax=Enterobacter mori TaxID=539813 RepID=UPI002236ACF0|nr:hypothetical protein [Enterobacter mori]MCW4989842.1 hypothetical protein [Enterobacter mori]
MVNVVIITDCVYHQAGVKSLLQPFILDGYNINFIIKSSTSFLHDLKEASDFIQIEASLIFADEKTFPLIKGLMKTKSNEIRLFSPDLSLVNINFILYSLKIPEPHLISIYKSPRSLSVIETLILQYSAKGYAISAIATMLQKHCKYVSQVRLRAYRKLNITNHAVMNYYTYINS